MRNTMILVGLMLILLLAAVPAAAQDGGLLGSGEVAPGGGEAPAADEVVQASGEVAQVGGEVGEDVLAATGFDGGVVLLVGLGLTTAGAAAVLASRKRARP